MSTEVYKLLADAIFVFHMVVLIELVSGSFLLFTSFGRKHQLYRRFHYILIFTAVSSQIVFNGCPLTMLEYFLRSHYASNYKIGSSFIVNTVYALIGVTIPVVLITLATAIIVFSTIIGLIICMFLERAESK